VVSLFAEVRRDPLGSLGGVLLAGRIDGGRGIRSHGRARRYPSYALTYVTAGTGSYRGSRLDLALGAGSLIYVTPGEPHWYGVTGESGWDEVYLVFDGPLFALAEEQGVIDRSRPVRTLLPVTYWRYRIERFRTRQPPRTPAERDAEACEVLRLLVDLQGATDPAPGLDPADDWFARSQLGLEADLSVALDLAGLAAEVGMPYETWRRHFRTRAGVPPARYRLLRRVDAATGLLAYTTLPARDIAAMVGFSDEHHLLRHVRAVTGLTPRQHRAASR
jgi:AraC-like DNA-binding protein